MNIIRPRIFSDSPNLTVAFTTSNREEASSGSGIDFGLNTPKGRKKVEQNYNRLAGFLGIKNDSFALAVQIHGTDVELVDEPGIYENRDGLVTTASGFGLGIQVADCAAVLIADEKKSVIGAFHAGWRGAVGGILPKGIEAMISAGGFVENFKVYISPCISLARFEVGEEVAVQFPDDYVNRTGYSKPHVDLKGFLVHQLIESGVNKNRIEVSGGCTMQDEHYFSYRREGERAGRMLGLIILNKGKGNGKEL